MNQLKRALNCFLSDQRGVAMVMVVISMIALLGITALVTDIGLLAANKQSLVNAVDAAVLAGAHELPEKPLLARDTAVSYALQNGCNPDEPEIDPVTNSKITVTATRQVDYIFAKVLGFTSGTVSANASARVAALTSHRGAAPLAIPDQEFDFNTRYLLKQGSNNDGSPLGPGTYGALSLGGTGARNYEDNLKYGYQETLRVGDIVNTETGNMSNPTKRAIDYRIDRCNHVPECTATSFDPGCPKILIIPVYEPNLLEDGQIKQIKILGFAAFLVERVEGQGNDNYIEGCFIKMVAEGDSDYFQVDYGLRGVKLIE